MNLDRCAIHTITHKPWSLQQCLEAFATRGVAGLSVWRNVIEPIGINEAARLVRASGLQVPALVRGGFFHAPGALDDNRKCIDEAAAIGADQVVLVCGAVPKMPLAEARKRIADGIAALLPYAQSNRVKLAIEPLHPMYAADRSAVNRMAEARHIWQALGSPWVGVAVDVYHVWWDPDLETEIAAAGKAGALFGFHVCDWRVETRDLLNDRGIMGDGCINIPAIRRCVESAGFTGLCEVEIFSTEHWSRDQSTYFNDVVTAFTRHV